MRQQMLWIMGIALMALLLASGCKTPQQRRTPHPVAAVSSTAPAPGPDESACPVLGTIMKKTDMLTLTYQGKTYYFCCEPCIGQFKADLQHYIQHPATPKRGM